MEDWHASNTIQLGELVRSGYVVWGEPLWRWDSYDEKQYWRCCEKIENRYFYRDISLTPPDVWRRELLRRINEIMPKLKLAYKALDEGVRLNQVGDDYGKRRNIYSDFPQTVLSSDNRDYASNGNDSQYEDVHDGNYLEQAQLLNGYDDIDVRLLDAVDPCFSCLFSVGY